MSAHLFLLIIVIALHSALLGNTNQKISDENQIKTFFEQGISAYNKKDFTAACDCFEKAELLSPDNIDVVKNLANSYYYAHDLEKSFMTFNKLSKLAPSDSNIYSNIGLIAKAVAIEQPSSFNFLNA